LTVEKVLLDTLFSEIKWRLKEFVLLVLVQVV